VDDGQGRLLAISDLHVGYAENREIVQALRPGSPADWLIVAGDIADKLDQVEWALSTLASRFSTVIWVPGNHELWTRRSDPDGPRGEQRYQRLVELARGLGVLTPEDPFPVFRGVGGPVTVVPMFLLYDYTFLPPGVPDKKAALALAYETSVVCTDEFLLHPDPYPSREDWCRERVRQTAARLDGCDPALPTVLVNHWPLTREPTLVLRYPQFAQWCGTTLTADWHRTYRAIAVVYGHLHIPRVTWQDGVRFTEVSVGYPREWQPRGTVPGAVAVLPEG
jgi:3',5'-cyclic AMP phosphodiesterase CpdA